MKVTEKLTLCDTCKKQVNGKGNHRTQAQVICQDKKGKYLADRMLDLCWACREHLMNGHYVFEKEDGYSFNRVIRPTK